jgi:hypothetical protein
LDLPLQCSSIAAKKHWFNVLAGTALFWKRQVASELSGRLMLGGQYYVWYRKKGDYTSFQIASGGQKARFVRRIWQGSNPRRPLRKERGTSSLDHSVTVPQQFDGA